MTHHPSLEELQDALDGEQPATEVREHVAHCELCRGHLAHLQRLDAELRALPAFEAPPGEWARISARLAPETGRSPWPKRLRQWLVGPSAAPQWAAAAGFGIVLFAAGLLTGIGVGRGEDPELSPELAALVELQSIRTRAVLAGAKGEATARALADASREALAQDPGNPTMHGLLFALATDQDRAKGQSKGAPRPAPIDSALYREVRKEVRERLDVLHRAAGERPTFGNIREAKTRRGQALVGLAGSWRGAFAGARVAPLAGGLAEVVEGPARGVLVLEVLPGTPAQEAGLRAGDVITAAQGLPVGTTSDLLARAAAAPQGLPLELYRGTERRSAVLRLRS